ncbi:hypothetical protein [Janibacter limosus]|uniref:hypothetical protein n=1 Tax=Janibacter limosus TaxID=53458 RepID=UPI000830D21A|nr:hypothetical protein [Janibacter limosus]
MRARHLIPAVLTACLVVTTAATAQAEDAPTDARVRITGELVRTSVEHRGDQQWSAVRVGNQLVPVAGVALDQTPAHATVTIDVKAPQSVVADAHRADLRDASDSTPATTSSTLGAASTAVATAPGTSPLEVTRVVAADEVRVATYAPATRRITYVEVTPRGMTREAVTETSATQQVARTDSYWREQSRSELRIAAPAMATRYTSAFSCADDPMKLWNEAIARTGWQWRDNRSLVLKLPSAASTRCGYGLGSLGDNPNSPGVLHVADTAAPVLAHELGHNMAFDHANRLVCTDRADAQYDTRTDWWTTCDEAEYGDSLDIMGPSFPTTMPMLSTPQALRHGLLPPAAAVRLGSGTTQVTLAALSGGAGTRAAVISNLSTGVTYWVEYRTPTGRDANNPSRQDAGVRVLRTSPWSGSVLLDPTPTGTLDNQTALGVGQTFASHDGRVKVTTESADASSAVVRIVNTSRRGAFTSTKAPTITGTRGVGKTLTATKGAWSPTPTTYTYRWKRNGASISGATKPTYTPTSADAGRTLTVSVAAHRTGYVSKAVSSAGAGIPIYATNRPYLKGTFRSGQTITVRAGAWTPRPSSYSYRWYRDNIAITGKTGTTYTLTSRDKGTRIHVHVTARRSGYVTGAAITLRSTVAR